MHDLQVTIDELASFPVRLARLFACFPRELWLWTPPSWDGVPSEKLNAVEQICHVRDIETDGYRVRFERTRLEVSPVLPDLGGEVMAQERQYSRQDPIAALRDFTAARVANVQAMRGFSDGELRRVAIFEERPTTLAGLIHYLSSHDCQHLAGLQWLLGRSELSLRAARHL